MNQSRRLAREQWRQIVEAQPVSGMTVAAYCREHQVTPSAFFAWKRKLRDSAARLPAAGFVEVRVSRAPPRAPEAAESEYKTSAIEICLNGMNGERCRTVTLLVRPGFNRELLVELIGVLEALEDRP
jgi:transposase-like protein